MTIKKLIEVAQVCHPLATIGNVAVAVSDDVMNWWDKKDLQGERIRRHNKKS